MNSEYREKIWTRAGPEFGYEARTIIIVRMVLCGLKSISSAFYVHLTKTLNKIGFLSTKADPDVWYRPAVKPNGFEYYKYILCYVNDILCISHNQGIALGRIQAVFKFKGGKIDQPEIYLGAQLVNIIVDGEEGWYMSVEKYVRAAVDNVEHSFAKSNQRLPTCCNIPTISGYHPETVTLPELESEGVTHFQ